MAPRTSKGWAKVYAGKRSLYENFTTKLHELIGDLLGMADIDVAQIEYRTKTVESFTEKMQRQGKDYDDPLLQVTDLSGIRIIAYYLEDVDKIGEMLKREFKIDEVNSVDKAQAADPDRFGYLSTHYVVSLSPSRKSLSEWKQYRDLKAEVQVRTVLQHAWAAIDHKLRYKAAREAPRSLRRQLFRLSALLELADDQFSDLSIRSEKLVKQYVKDVGIGDYDIELNLASMDAYLESSKQHLKWMRIAEEVGFKKPEQVSPEGEETNRSRLLKILQTSGITTIHEFNGMLGDVDNWGKDVLGKVCKASSKEGFVPFAVPHDVLTILTVFGRKNFISRLEIVEIDFKDPLTEALFEVVTKRKGEG